MTYQPFEKWLQEYHSKLYIGFDDDMPDAFDEWLGALETSTLIGLGDLYGKEITRDNQT